MGGRLASATPLFLLGAARSGTTILAKILNSHPDILMTNETAVLLALAGLIKKSRQGVTAGVWYGKTYNVLWADLLRQRAKELVVDFYEQIAAAEGKESVAFWGDKHPYYCDCLEFIHELFPNAKYIFIIRDPRDVATSIAQMVSVPLAMGISSVARFLEAYDAFFQNHPELPIYMVKYEDLVADYRTTTMGVLDWLGLPMTPEVERFVQERSSRDAHTPMTDDIPRRDFRMSVGRWREVFGEEEWRLALRRLGAFLKRYGYI